MTVPMLPGHEWKSPIRWQVFDVLVGESDNKEEYRQILLDSSFTLCPVGTGDDNFRFWEAIEAGSIPVFVPRDMTLLDDPEVLRIRGERDCPDSFQDVMSTNPPVITLGSWASLPKFLDSVTETQLKSMRHKLLMWNHDFWTNTTRYVDDAIKEGAAKYGAGK